MSSFFFNLWPAYFKLAYYLCLQSVYWTYEVLNACLIASLQQSSGWLMV